MKTLKFLLVFYACFLIAAPMAMIIGHLSGVETISRVEYIWAVGFFTVGLAIYFLRDKKVG